MDKERPKRQENTEPDPEDSLEELDDDQLKAFESIMSQIEGNEAAEIGAEPETETKNEESDAPSELNEDAFNAELESVVVKAASAMEASSESGKEEVGPDDELDDEQLKAFESIMSQIEGAEAGTEDKKTLPSEAVMPVSQSENNDSANPEPAAIETVGDNRSKEKADLDPPEETTGETTGQKVEDISDDIEDLLNNIASEDDETVSEESEAIVLTKVEQNGADIPGDSEGEDLSGKKTDDLDQDVSEEKKRTAEKKVPQEPRQVGNEAPDTETPLEKKPAPDKSIVAAPPRNKHRILVPLSISLILVLFVSGGIYWKWGDVMAVDESEPLQEGQTPVAAVNHTTDISSEKPAIENDREDSVRRLDRLIESVSQLRNEVTQKQEEIHSLRDYYQAGIEEEMEGLFEFVPAAEAKKKGPGNIPEDSRVILGLEAIQRRDATIKRLIKPSEKLFLINEELLFLSRKSKMMTLMVGETSDIDVDTFVEKTMERCDRFRAETDSLNIDGNAVSEIGLNSIWGEVVQRSKKRDVAERRRKKKGSVDNEEIWNEICEGDYSRKDMLTDLSSEAAGCLAKWEGKDLYLNGLTSLSPEAARQLSDWKGEWLGLNGLTELSTPTATQLANWKGRVLSLNGLTHLSPKIVDILSAWQGDQIELINVRHMAQWENPKTRLFLSEEYHQHFAKRE
jgi:hypothetical protein